MLCLSGVYEVSATRIGMAIPYTGHRRRDMVYSHDSSNFRHKLFKVVCILKTCLSSILTTQILPRDWRELFWIIVLVVEKKLEKRLGLTSKISVFRAWNGVQKEYLGNRNWYSKKLLSVPREGDRDYFAAQTGLRSRLGRSKSYEKNSIL